MIGIFGNLLIILNIALTALIIFFTFETLKRINECISKPLIHSYYYPTRIRAEFCKKLIEMTPNNLEKAIVLSVGTEAAERAIKIARIYGKSLNQDKQIIVGGDGNYHGKTLGAQMVGGQHADKNWIGYTDPNMKHLPFPFPWVLDVFDGDGKDLFNFHLEELEKSGVNEVWIGNAGKSGLSSRDIYLHIKYALPHLPNPDLTLLMVGVNDFLQRLQEDKDWHSVDIEEIKNNINN